MFRVCCCVFPKKKDKTSLGFVILSFEQIAASYGKQVIIFEARSASASNNHVRIQLDLIMHNEGIIVVIMFPVQSNLCSMDH